MHWTYCHTEDFSDTQLQQAYTRLSDSRKEHIDRLQQPEDKRRSLAAQLLTEQLLEEQYGIHDAILHRRPNGQPYLSGCEMFVSISHCDKLVACAVSSEPVGIDIERIRPVSSRICHHVCTDEETAWLLTGRAQEAAFRDPEVLRRFFEIWCAKEAYFKKCGTGITDLKSVNALTLPCRTHRIEGYILQIL